ncbi:hypothetical protein RBH76_05930 [Oscillospiraceae bacterium MB24-C1]|nr:hypothetical protein RBH76_05930 [Oscillospiraceae bacterium MB24-C1]
MPLEITINKQAKIVQVWLNNAEQQDAALRESLKPLYNQYRTQKYLVAVMTSGNRNLGNATSDLLCHNRKHLARLEIERDKQSDNAIAV